MTFCQWPPRTERCSDSNFKNCLNHHHHHIINGVCVIPYDKEKNMSERDDLSEQAYQTPTPPDSELPSRARVADDIEMATSREEVLGLAIGAGSACWETLEEAGVFDSTEARLILESAAARIREMDQPLLGLASTQELINELSARFTTFQFELAQSFQDFLNYRTVDPK